MSKLIVPHQVVVNLTQKNEAGVKGYTEVSGVEGVLFVTGLVKESLTKV